MIWTVLNAFARILPGYPWGLFPAFPSRDFQPHLQLALFLTLMELNKSNLELERAQTEMRDIDLRLREVKMELREAKRRLFEAIKAQVELRELKRKLRHNKSNKWYGFGTFHHCGISITPKKISNLHGILNIIMSSNLWKKVSGHHAPFGIKCRNHACLL